MFTGQRKRGVAEIAGVDIARLENDGGHGRDGQCSILRQCPLLQFHDRKLGDFIFTCLSLETFQELSKVFVLFMIVLSVTGLYLSLIHI